MRVAEIDQNSAGTGLSILYPSGHRPTHADAARVLREAAIGFLQNDFVITAGGMTFEIAGLAPGAAAPLPPGRHFFGMVDSRDSYPFEAITLTASRATLAEDLLQQVAAKARIATALAEGSGARALCWNPAASWMEVAYFARLMANWLTGGPFPSLGLTAIQRLECGGVVSDGLAFFTGQELRVDPRNGEHATDTVKLAVRTIDVLVREGRLTAPRTIQGPGDEVLTAEPSEDGATVLLRRAA